MKKILLFMLITGLFSLVSCGNKNPNSGSSNSITSTTDPSIQTSPSESSNNTQSSSTENKPSTAKEKEDESVYNDTISWGPLH